MRYNNKFYVLLLESPDDIIYVMPCPPQPSGKTGRIFRIPECELTEIEELSQN
jgi:hypothetical protein